MTNILVRLCIYWWSGGEKNKLYLFWVWISSLFNRTQNACSVLYYYVLRVSFYHTFPHYLKSDIIFRKEVIEYKINIFIFLQIISVTFPFI